MRMVAYKTADNTRVKDSLPSGWIVEHTFVDAQPPNSLKVEDGWEFIAEDEFITLLETSNSQSRMDEYTEAKRAEQLAQLALFAQIAEEEQKKNDALKAEFEAFKKWKESR